MTTGTVCMIVIRTVIIVYLCTTVQDIAGYEDNELVVLALHLLNRYFSMESDLFEKATESQVSTCSNIPMYNACVFGSFNLPAHFMYQALPHPLYLILTAP